MWWNDSEAPPETEQSFQVINLHDELLAFMMFIKIIMCMMSLSEDLKAENHTKKNPTPLCS